MNLNFANIFGIILMLVSVFSVAGCASFSRASNPVVLDTIDEPVALTVQADRRVVIVYPHLKSIRTITTALENIENKQSTDNKQSKEVKEIIEVVKGIKGISKEQYLSFCAEPVPDTFGEVQKALAAASKINADIGMAPGSADLASVKANLDQQVDSTKAIVANVLFRRSQGVQTLRDGFFGLCQLAMNGWSEDKLNEALMLILTDSSALIKAEIPYMARIAAYDRDVRLAVELTKQKQADIQLAHLVLAVKQQDIYSQCVTEKTKEAQGKLSDEILNSCKKASPVSATTQFIPSPTVPVTTSVPEVPTTPEAAR